MILRSMSLTIVAVAFVILVTIAGTLGAFLADREPPVQVSGVEVLSEAVPPGGKLRLRFHVVRARSCETNVDRVLRDSADHQVILDDVSLFAAPGRIGSDSFITAIDIPDDFVAGPAWYVTTTQFRCNAVHQVWPITGPTRTIAFRVDPRATR